MINRLQVFFYTKMIITMKNSALFLLVFFLTIQLVAQERIQQTLNDTWRFKKGKNPAAQEIDFHDKNWEIVTLPHSWNANDALIKKDYYRGPAWYRKTLKLHPEYRQKQLFLRFEGVHQHTEVYLNGQFVGEHKGGYTAFNVNITEFVDFQNTNILSVRVDNSWNESIPPLSGDFTMWGGIYRDVYLIATNKIHFQMLDNSSDGIYVSTPIVNEKIAVAEIMAEVVNDNVQNQSIFVQSVLFDAEGNQVKKLTTPLNLSANESVIISQKLKDIVQPKLWSPSHPYLYRLETSIYNAADSSLFDRLHIPLGFRWFKFNPEKGFSLNGKPMKLIGVNRHQDYENMGSGVSDEIHRHDIELIKQMGANFLRIAHYPQDPAVLEACDKLGLLVWEEIPIVDMITPSQEFFNVSKNMLKEMIHQHYNHPSVIMWGYMNEAVLGTIRKVESIRKREHILEQTVVLADELERLAREEDPYRATAMAFHGGQIYNELGMGEIPMVVGWNKYEGWYGGEFEQFGEYMDAEHQRYPDRPLFISEFGAGSDKRVHSTRPECFDFSIEYQQKYHESYLPQIIERDYISGASVWNLIDFGSAIRDESMPRINNKGLLYYNREKKDIYYYFKAMLSDEKVIHIASRDWPKRKDLPQEAGKHYALHPVKVYSNWDSIELFLNGRTLGKKGIQNYHASWDVPFVEGKNQLKARYKDAALEQEDVMYVDFKILPFPLNDSTLTDIEIGVNVGSTAYYTNPNSRFIWMPDKAYSPGSYGYIGGEIYRSTPYRLGIQVAITGTVHEPLYQTLRDSIQGYRFDVPDGRYEVKLMFAEPGVKREAILNDIGAEAGKVDYERVFDVKINGKTYIHELNLAGDYGAVTAVPKEFIITATEKQGIHVEFINKKGSPILNAIKIRKF